MKHFSEIISGLINVSRITIPSLFNVRLEKIKPGLNAEPLRIDARTNQPFTNTKRLIH